MAYQTGTYSDINNLLTLFAAWAVTNGWTQNLLTDDASYYSGSAFTGKRLHIQKTINGTTCYFNFRSCSAQRVFSYGSYATVTGICVNGSTGFSSALAWDLQTGYPVYSSTYSYGGCIDKIPTAGGTYTFYAQDGSLSMEITSESTELDHRFLSVGCTDIGIPVFAASGSDNNSYSSTSYYDRRSCFLGYTGSSKNGQGGALFGGTWYMLTNLGTYTYSMMPAIYPYGTTATVISGSYPSVFTANSPESFRGNAPLPPCALTIVKSTANQYYPIGTLEGIHFINMSNYTNGAEIVIGSDTFKCYRSYNSNPSGVAFKM